MASPKDKLLESAQKFILKGQLDKAVKDYQQIVALDPKYRQKLAELLVRLGRNQDAVAEYEIIAKGYADTCFYLKSIAVYKQIQKLDPDSIRINSNLAVLYEKQGLIANALSELKTVCDYFNKLGQPAEAIKTLEKMQEIDPDNPSILLKLAEARYHTDQKEMAYHEFKQLALMLKKRGDEPGFTGVCGRIGQLFPDKNDLVLELLSAEIERGNPTDAIEMLQGMLKRDPTNLKLLSLLITAYRAAGDVKNRKLVYRHIMRHYPDDFLPKEGLVECAVEEGDIEKALTLLHFNTADFIAKGRLESLEGFYHQLRSIAPEDPRILEGLIKLYRMGGQTEKVEAMTLLLAQVRDAEEVLDVEEVSTVEEEETATIAAAVPVETAHVPAPDTWEEEIVLSLPEDVPPPTPVESPAAQARVLTDELVLDEAVVEDLLDEGPDAAIATGDAAGDYVEVDLDFDEGDLDFLDEPTQQLSADGEIIYTFDELLSKFKEGVDRQLEKTDTENHYNLGIAYKEMGLYDEAIAEFQIAAADRQRLADCITLEGICYRDKGDYARSEEAFIRGGSVDGLKAEEVYSLTYELALLYESTSRSDEAMSLYRAIWQQQPAYRDVKRKIVDGLGGDVLDDMEISELELIDLDGDEL